MPLEVKLSYTMQDLAMMLSVEDRTVERWLREKQVPISKIGRRKVVWLADLAAAFPEIERSIAIKREFDASGSV